MKKKYLGISFAVLAAVLYSFSTPFSKIILNEIGSTYLAGLLYFGAGLGMSVFFIVDQKRNKKDDLITKKELPYTFMMVILDILAPIFLMYGLSITNAGNVSLLNNFEIVATSLIALIVFKEVISVKLWIGIFLVTVASFFLSFEDLSTFTFSKGALFVLLATLCWGIENNCTRKLSDKNTYEVVMIKGLCCGFSSLFIGFLLHDKMNSFLYVLFALALGFVAYGLSIFFYVRAQNTLGASKTSSFYAINPFIGALLSFLILKEKISWSYFLALGIMLLGTAVIVLDTLTITHTHEHTHVITHTHDGTTHTHVITHSHEHTHVFGLKNHLHGHTDLLKAEHRHP